MTSESEISLTLEKLVINSLQLLGFCKYDFPKDMKVLIEVDTFKNSLGVFVFSWPPRTPDMKREFKEEAFKLVVKLEQEGKIPENSILGKSVLDSAQGERVWALLKTLTDSALKLQITGLPLPFYPNLHPYIQNPATAIRSSVLRMKKSMICHIKRFASDFNKNSQIIVGKQTLWTDHAKFLTNEHKNLRNLFDNFVNKKKKIDPNTHIVEKLAALDRVPQIDMIRYIWKNIRGLVDASHSRNGEELISQIVRDSETTRKISGNVQQNLQDWGKTLEEISNKIENESHPNSIQYFANQLKDIKSKYQKTQQTQLETLQKHRELLYQKYLGLQNSIDS